MYYKLLQRPTKLTACLSQFHYIKKLKVKNLYMFSPCRIVIKEYTHQIITYRTLCKIFHNSWSWICCTTCSRSKSREKTVLWKTDINMYSDMELWCSRSQRHILFLSFIFADVTFAPWWWFCFPLHSLKFCIRLVLTHPRLIFDNSAIEELWTSQISLD